jgi:predicted transcriptional regulator of viral defense system
MIFDAHNINSRSLGRLESRFLAKVGPMSRFSTADAKAFLGKDKAHWAPQFLDRLEEKGWIRRIKGGQFAVVPLSSGESRNPQLHEFIVAMTLVQPAAIAYLSAMNYHGFTEQLPRTVFIVTDHRVARRSIEALGMSFRIVCLTKKRFFGYAKEWIDEKPVMIADRERTIIDGLDLPEHVGGVGLVADALRDSWEQLNEKKLIEYTSAIGNAAVAKRLGYLMEKLGKGNAEALQPLALRGAGYAKLDPTLPARGKHIRRWRLLLNAGPER